jgi:multiple sugar transport system substrate-binding protein
MTPSPVEGPRTGTPPTPGTPQLTPPRPSTPSPITLIIWTSEEFSPNQKDASGQILKQQYDSFMAANPGITVRYQLKKQYDKGGLLDFLLTTAPVVPSALPDIIVLDTFEVGEAARAELLQPLDPLLSSDLRRDLFAFADEATRFDGQQMAIPFTADIQHLAFRSVKDEKPPHTWVDLLAGKGTYLFPTGKDIVATDALLIQYFALDGRLTSNGGAPIIDEEKLIEVWRFYRDIRDKGLMPKTSSEVHSLDDAWAAYTAGKVTMTNVSSRRYQSDKKLLQNTVFAPIPTKDGTVMTMSQSWSYAIVTKDPLRAAAAAKFIEWLMNPTNLTAWNRAANRLPTRRSVYEGETVDDYTRFAKEQLDHAGYRPPLMNFQKIAAALETATQDVLAGNASPEEAAARVAAVVREGK